MKRVLALLVTMTMVGSMLMGCGSNAAGDSQQAEGESTETASIDENHKLRVGVLAAMTALPVVDMVNNGLDKENRTGEFLNRSSHE